MAKSVRRNDHSQNNRRRNGQDKQERVTCTNCGKEHCGECLLGKNICFKCVKPGQAIRYCKEGQWASNYNDNERQKKTQA